MVFIFCSYFLNIHISLQKPKSLCSEVGTDLTELEEINSENRVFTVIWMAREVTEQRMCANYCCPLTVPCEGSPGTGERSGWIEQGQAMGV